MMESCSFHESFSNRSIDSEMNGHLGGGGGKTLNSLLTLNGNGHHSPPSHHARMMPHGSRPLPFHYSDDDEEEEEIMSQQQEEEEQEEEVYSDEYTTEGEGDDDDEDDDDDDYVVDEHMNDTGSSNDRDSNYSSSGGGSSYDGGTGSDSGSYELEHDQQGRINGHNGGGRNRRHHHNQQQIESSQSSYSGTGVSGTEDPDDTSCYGSDRNNDDTSVRSEMDEVKAVERYARNDTRNVKAWRAVVFLTLLIMGAVISVAAYALLHQEGREDYQTSYKIFVNTMRDASQFHMQTMSRAFGGLSESITAAGTITTTTTKSGGSTTSRRNDFPLVTVPMFELHGQHVIGASGAELVSYSALVAGPNKTDWENYAREHQTWLEESYQLQQAQSGQQEQTQQEYYYQSTDNNNNTLGQNMQGDEENNTNSTYLDEQKKNNNTNTKKNETTITPHIFDWNGTHRVPARGDQPFYAPVWQVSPPPLYPELVNMDLASNPLFVQWIHILAMKQESVWSDIRSVANVSGIVMTAEDHFDFHSEQFPIPSLFGTTNSSSSSPAYDYYERPHSLYLTPVFDQIRTKQRDDKTNGTLAASANASSTTTTNADPAAVELVGFVTAVIPWDRYMIGLLPDGVNGIVCVLRNNCGQSYTYLLHGNNASYLGPGDMHDHAFDNMEQIIPLDPHYDSDMQDEYDEDTQSRTADFVNHDDVSGHCQYYLYVYPSQEFKRVSESDTPAYAAAATCVTFLVMAISFTVYDCFVRRRNQKVMDATARANALVSSMFPSNVRDRLLANKQEQLNRHASASGGIGRSGLLNQSAPMTRLKRYLHSDVMGAGDDDEDFVAERGKPIADLFPETTIIFSDIAGFTAWSSIREPSQVFTLLETLYRAFDTIAKKRRVFKVETVGDCYVAVTGLPDPRKDHAVVMARFARDCMSRMHVLTKKMEITLGPDTGDLSIRVGMHSGPVTAGVLRGERSRFQLFGDTMNTASRMETTGIKGRIHISQETADLLVSGGKGHWVKPREETVVAKGKGEMQTYWLEVNALMSDATSQLSSSGKNGTNSDELNSSMTSLEHVELTATQTLSEGKKARLIDWNTEMLLQLLRQVVARRNAASCALSSAESARLPPNENRWRRGRYPMGDVVNGNTEPTVLDEVCEIIMLPEFDATTAQNQEAHYNIALDARVPAQLRDYVSSIAAMYRDNPFHDFEHASHVTMSVAKLLSRIVAPSHLGGLTTTSSDKKGKEEKASTLHDHTYGITSDPLTQFSCVLSALIHDVDHPGVPNSQLVKEKNKVALAYNNKAIAEQNSVDLAWDLLMDDGYKELRATIYQSDSELRRFRQLVVNSVMATDIIDKDLKGLRNARWDKAFNNRSQHTVTSEPREDINRKATIVIEHLIQASDVAHTMQHWHIYRKWNERFFFECYLAYRRGRADKDPAFGWYQGELGFFDFYIIPLAKKLKDCGVFGVSSDEYLNYAVKNREEWEVRGQEIVAEMIEDVAMKVRGESRPATIPDPQLNSNPGVAGVA